MTITTKPTRTEGSIGATKTDRRPATGASWEWSAAQINEISDRVVELFDEVGLSDGSNAGSLNERVLTLEVDGGGALAAWNGVDTIQFDAPVTSGFTGATWDTYAVNGQLYLRFSATAGSAGDSSFLWFTDTVPMRSMEAEAFVGVTIVTSPGDGIFGGVAFAGVDGASPPLANLVAHGVDPAGTAKLAWASFNGANPTDITSANADTVGTVGMRVQWTDADMGVPPAYLARMRSSGNTGGFVEKHGLPGLVVLPAVDSAWNNAQPTKIGIGVYCAGAANAVEIVFSAIRFEAR